MKEGPRYNDVLARLVTVGGLATLFSGINLEFSSHPQIRYHLIGAGLATFLGGLGLGFRRHAGYVVGGIGSLLLAIRFGMGIPETHTETRIAAMFFGIIGLLAIAVWLNQWHLPERGVIYMDPPAPSSREPRAAQTSSSSGNPPPDRTLSHLEVGEFAPISAEELKRRAKKIDRSLIFRFGLRSQIPPAADERTLLIDRALVSHGLLTPERLKEIHDIGETYLKLRPTLQSAFAAEERAEVQAVADDKAQRAAVQEAKRAEAAAKREKRAAEIAERETTDIVFLGRGVSGGLNDRRANIEKLTALGLPVLTSPADIAAALNCTIPRLRWLAFHSEASSVSHYVRFTIPKKSGGTRELAAPHRDMAAAQRWILWNILDRVPMRDCAHGFIRGRNVMSNAVPHVRRDAVVNADLKDFFPAITYPRVKGIFEGLGYSPAAATVLALLCTECPRRTAEVGGRRLHVAAGPRALPQGACTSPALSNLAARKLDARLEGLARKTGWTYTRYADDLTFSASGETAQQCGGLLQALRRFCQEESFTVNEKKTRVQRQNAQQTVTGIVVNRRPNAPREVYRRVRAILHAAQKTGLAAQNKDGHPNFRMHVHGMIAWVHMSNPERGKKLREAWEKLEER